MTPEKRSPRIDKISWGRIEVDELGKTFRDAKLFPGGGREWDWNETGTHHEPGIQIVDVEELLAHGAQVIVLSKGFHERLQVCPETLKLLQDKNITLHILQTEKAADVYNALTGKEAVGGLFHSTC